MASQIQVRALGVGSSFRHVGDEGNKTLQPERVFKVVATRASTVIVENGIGVRSSMSKMTPVLPIGEPAQVQTPAVEGEKKAVG